MENQQTVAGSAAYSGIALHSGARSSVRVRPAPENTGIVFRRVDLPGKPEVRALASNVVDVRRGTTIAAGNAVVFTVEHIMSALHAFRVDNCIVEMDGMEPPIGDGSSLPYCKMLREAGVVRQEAEAKVFTPAGDRTGAGAARLLHHELSRLPDRPAVLRIQRHDAGSV